jgi:hypothetical protein
LSINNHTVWPDWETVAAYRIEDWNPALRENGVKAIVDKGLFEAFLPATLALLTALNQGRAEVVTRIAAKVI